MAKRIGQPFRQPGVLCLAVLAALAGGGGVAYAAYCGLEDDGSSSYHAPAPTVSPKSVRAGEAVTVTASGLDAGSEYYVHINSYSADYYLGHDYTQTADAAGALPPQKWWVPPTAIAGLYALYVVHAVSGSISHSTTIEVSAPEPKPESSCTYMGGLYKNVPPATGCERHHIPSQASFRGIGAYTKECTPVIRMDKRCPACRLAARVHVDSHSNELAALPRR